MLLHKCAKILFLFIFSFESFKKTMRKNIIGLSCGGIEPKT